eukprot:2633419-Rhodomonas_salina.1
MLLGFGQQYGVPPNRAENAVPLLFAEGAEEAGACVPGWRRGGERNWHQVAPTAAHAPPHSVCQALWGRR